MSDNSSGKWRWDADWDCQPASWQSCWLKIIKQILFMCCTQQKQIEIPQHERRLQIAALCQKGFLARFARCAGKLSEIHLSVSTCSRSYCYACAPLYSTSSANDDDDDVAEGCTCHLQIMGHYWDVSR